MNELEPHPDRSAADEPKGRGFESSVADVYAALGYSVKRNVRIDGQEVDVLAQRAVEGAGIEILAVECKDKRNKVGNQEVQNWVATTTTLRAGGAITRGVLISASGFTADAEAVARSVPYASLFTWEELSREVFNVKQALASLIADYERHEIYSTYIDVAASQAGWDEFQESHVTHTAKKIDSVELDLRERIAQTSSSERSGAVLILGDYGAGKSTILHRIQYQLSRDYLDGRSAKIPLYVALRQFKDRGDMSTLLRTSFRDQFFIDAPSELLRRRIDAGSFVLLFDGFDEMAERSDEARRLKMFRDLLPFLVSPSVAILTSRPSFFVGRGELDSLLRLLRAREQTLALGGGNPGDRASSLESLRRSLFQKNRESRPGMGAYDTPDASAIDVFTLLPLDEGHVIEYLLNLEDRFQQEANVTADEVLRFIEDTYDLNDLATRPLLLKLIADTVLERGLDVRDTSLQLGPSGLYELYTDLKLDFDLDKTEGRIGGLPKETRRALAEFIAMKMHSGLTLELDLRETLGSATRDPEAKSYGVDALPLAPDEVLTDIATCSFVRVDPDDGTCRFIHKSFRGFFVARVLKTRIGSSHPAFLSPLEQEVLYFLGGFGPTEPDVTKNLWTNYREAEVAGQRVTARNLLCAYLYTSPTHTKRNLTGEISEVTYRSMQFAKCELVATTVSRCEFGDLGFASSKIEGVLFDRSHISNLALTGGTARMMLDASLINNASFDDCSIRLSFLADSVVESIHSLGSRLELTAAREGEDVEVRTLVAERVDLHMASEFGGSTADSSAPRVLLVEASKSIIRLNSKSRVGSVRCRSSIVVVAELDQLSMLEQVTPESIILPSKRFELVSDLSAVAESSCGFFDFAVLSTDLLVPRSNNGCWGIIALAPPEPVLMSDSGEPMLDEDRARRRVEEPRGVRAANFYYVGKGWLQRETQSDGRLSALGELRDHVGRTSRWPEVPSALGQLDETLARLRAQFVELSDTWEGDIK